MQVRIKIDEALIDKAMSLTGLKTRQEAIEAGLRLLVQIHEQQAVRNLKGKIEWSGNLDDMRSDHAKSP